MNATSIRGLAVQAVDAFYQCGYTERSIGEKKWILFKIVEQHEEHGVSTYSTEIVAQFIQTSERRYENGEIDRTHYRFLIKTATYLTDLHSNGVINFGKRFVPKLPDYYENLLDGLLAYDNWNIKSRHSVWPFAKSYFGWLISEGHNDLSRVDESVIKHYLIDCSSRMTGSSLDTTKRLIKKLYAHLFEAGICAESHENLLSFSVPVERKIKRPVPDAEIAAVLNVIDRSTAIGKRDYAIILLAAVTGLRAIDIVELKLSPSSPQSSF